MKSQNSKVFSGGGPAFGGKRQNQNSKIKSILNPFNFLLVVLPFSFLLFTSHSYAEPFYIDHFEKTNNVLGGRSSVYEQPPSKALATITDKEYYGPAGHSLAIRYDKRNTGGPQNEGGWCGYYSLLKVGGKYFDATGYKKLTFWVKGAEGGENFKVGIADKHWEGIGDSVKSDEITAYLQGKKITTEWQQAAIPLDTFFVDMKELASISICFEGDCFPDKSGKGIVYVDEIAFE